MIYTELEAALEAHRRGANISETLRNRSGGIASPSIVELSYDLQAGSYVEYVRDDPDGFRRSVDEKAELLAQHFAPGDRVLDVGTGEMTTLAGVAGAAFPDASELHAIDISWSRLHAGRAFIEEELAPGLAARVRPAVADLFNLPYRAGAMDLVWTAHALEPNGGREVDAIRELLRVCRRRLVLMEPSYELNSGPGRRRMDQHGYVRALPEAVAAAGGELLDAQPLDFAANALNPTTAYIVRPTGEIPDRPDVVWACPTTGHAADEADDHIFSPVSRLAYMKLRGIPVVRREAAVLASSLYGSGLP